ncbi:MAG: hypothetical protein OEY63_08585, partial [Gemmatimonadota bacterium]|nr:hypothetical protein [Gemmatimonadota bacterium]
MKTTCRQSVVTFVWLLALNGLYSVPGHTQQELHYDETQRLFTLRYIGSDGEQYELVIIPANHIEPYMTIAIHQSRTADLQYGYHLLNRTGPLSEQKLFLFEVDSPLPAELNRVSSPEGWSLNQRFDGSHKRHYWGFHTSDQFALDPGEFISFEFQSQMLPRLMNGRFVGMAPEIPALEATQGNPEVGALVGNTNGVFGGWYQLQVVAPGRSHDELSNPIAGVDILNSDLGDVCQLSWITNPGVCN